MKGGESVVPFTFLKFLDESFELSFDGELNRFLDIRRRGGRGVG